MNDQQPAGDPIEAVAALAEPTRRALYDLVAASTDAVGRDDAAAALGISRELAAFHLDRLIEAGLLQAEYRRRSGRTGPGAGRPAKLYRRTTQGVEVSLPARRYERAADIMATALGRLEDGSGVEALAQVAREQGVALGASARRKTAGGPAGTPASMDGLVDVLDGEGYEPLAGPDGAVRLRNCPYRVLAEHHRDITCGMNLAWAHGLVDGLGVPHVSVELAPEPGRCCVVFEPEAKPAG